MANGTFSPWSEFTSGVPQGGVASPYLFLLHMSTQNVFYSDTLDIGYADDVGLSRAIPLTIIKEDTSMDLEAKQLEEWATSNNMLLNGKKPLEIRICFFRHYAQPAPLILGGQEVPVDIRTLDHPLNDLLPLKRELHHQAPEKQP
uniref:Reverse transcriptase domain-containing protein n=1 Tax=Oncorhynchus kisutch TaxID=8019 RepID=A0A8C7G191_ONCKI